MPLGFFHASLRVVAARYLVAASREDVQGVNHIRPVCPVRIDVYRKCETPYARERSDPIRGDASAQHSAASIESSASVGARLRSIQWNLSGVLQNIKTSRKPVIGVNKAVPAYNEIVHLNCATFVAWNLGRKVGNLLGLLGITNGIDA